MMLVKVEADAARDMLLSVKAVPAKEKVCLGEALGRVLSADIRTVIDTPPFDRSPFDGYALRGEDTLGATKDKPVALSITEEIPAGCVPKYAVTEGHAAKILTGAPIPKGANATVRYEDTKYTANEVRIFEPIMPNSDVVYAGEDTPKGTVIARAGDVVTAPLLGQIAGQGIAEVPVYRRPKIAVLNTGTELTEVGLPLAPGKIYNSNVYSLNGYLSKIGAEPGNFGIVMDDLQSIAEKTSAALEVSDMVITTGGASVGDYDWAVRSAQKLGADVLFWKIQIKPGGAMMAAVKDGKLILGLSGNPGAAVIGLLRIAAPYIKKLCGRTDVLPQETKLIMKMPFKKSSQTLRLLRGKLEIEEGKAYFSVSSGQKSGQMVFAGSDMLGEIPAGSPPVPAGTFIKAYRI